MSCKYMKKINKLNKKLNKNKEYQELSEIEKNAYFDKIFNKGVK